MTVTGKSRGTWVCGDLTVLDDLTINDDVTITGDIAIAGDFAIGESGAGSDFTIWGDTAGSKVLFDASDNRAEFTAYCLQIAGTTVDAISISGTETGNAINITGAPQRAICVGTKTTGLAISTSGYAIDTDPNNYMFGLFSAVTGDESALTDELRGAWIRTRVDAGCDIGQSAGYGYGVCGAESQLKIYGSGGTETNIRSWQASGLWAQLETQGDSVHFEDGCVAASVLAMVGLTATTVIESGAVVAGVAIKTNSATADVTTTGDYVGMYISSGAGSKLAFEKGIYITDSCCTTGIDIGACTTGLNFSSTLGTGISFYSATFVPDASRTDLAIDIGSRATELSVDLANAASQNFDPVQMNINLTASGGAPTSTSTVNGIYQNITHDTVDMANLRIKGCDWTITTDKACQDAYVMQTELIVSGTKTSSGELMAMSALTTLGTGARTADRVLAFQAMISGSGTAGTVVGDAFVAYVVNAGTVITTDAVVKAYNQSASTTADMINIENDGTCTTMLTLDNDGTATTGILFNGTIATLIDMSAATSTTDIILSNGATIHNTSADFLTITEAELGIVGKLTVGASGVGHEVKFHGDTASYNVWFDDDGDTNKGTWYFGDDTYGVDTVFNGQTTASSMSWDASAIELDFVKGSIEMTGLLATQGLGSPYIGIGTSSASIDVSTFGDNVLGIGTWHKLSTNAANSLLGGYFKVETDGSNEVADAQLVAVAPRVTVDMNLDSAYGIQSNMTISGTKTSSELISVSAYVDLGTGARTADRVCALQAMISGSGTAGTVVGDCFVAYIANRGTVITTDAILNVHNQSAATAADAIRMDLNGTVTYAFNFAGTVADAWTTATGGTSVTPSGEYVLIPVDVVGTTNPLYVLAAQTYTAA